MDFSFLKSFVSEVVAQKFSVEEKRQVSSADVDCHCQQRCLEGVAWLVPRISGSERA